MNVDEGSLQSSLHAFQNRVYFSVGFNVEGGFKVFIFLFGFFLNLVFVHLRVIQIDMFIDFLNEIALIAIGFDGWGNSASILLFDSFI